MSFVSLGEDPKSAGASARKENQLLVTRIIDLELSSSATRGEPVRVPRIPSFFPPVLVPLP